MSPNHSKRTTVVKIGGSTLGTGDTTLEDLVTLQGQGIPVVVVHGGGNIVSQWMERLGALPHFIRGLRVTDQETLDLVIAVLAGLVNKQLVAKIQALGGKAIGFCGVDGATLNAVVASSELGFVGEVTKVETELVEVVLNTGAIPVIAPLALHFHKNASDGAILNINGDTAAGALASALKADRLVFLTDVEGIMDTSGQIIRKLLPSQGRALIDTGVVSGGMIPKVDACVQSMPPVGTALIVDGRMPHALPRSMGKSEFGTQFG
jgi:acetylglutamate kinase